jgi:hypothetical protein
MSKSKFKSDEEVLKHIRLYVDDAALDVIKVLYQEHLTLKRTARKGKIYEETMPLLAREGLISYSKAHKRHILNSSGLHLATVLVETI